MMLMILLQKSSLFDSCGLALGTVVEITVPTVTWVLDFLYSITADFKASFRCIELCCKKKEYSSTISIAVQYLMIRKSKSKQ